MNTITKNLKQEPMRRLQIITIAICVVINMLDGFDVLVMAFSAPSIAQEWSLQASALGGLFSAGLIGMALGSLFLSPYADIIGRKKLIVLALALMTAGMLLSAITQSYWQLFFMRIVTGLAIGAALASLNTLVAEYASHKRKNLSIAILQAGYPIGATLGGLISALLIGQFGWPSLFLFGGILSLLLIPIVLFWLPESLDYLITCRPQNALLKINKILARLGRTSIDTLPEVQNTQSQTAFRVGTLLNSRFRAPTLYLWSAYFLLMFSFYFVISWTPKILVDAGLSVEKGISGSVLMNLGGILGCLSIGYYSSKIGLKKSIQWVMILCAISMLAFAFSSGKLALMLPIAFLIGFFLLASMIGLYALAPDLYPTEIRTTGMGWSIGIGRLGAIAGPFLAGVLMSTGWSPGHCFFAFLFPLIFAALVVSRIKHLP